MPSRSSPLPLLDALARRPLPAPPVWLMRQAGRYLPEYRAVRQRAGGFLAMAQTPELAAEVTLQPVRRFGVDAAILFSDILLPLQAMGMPLRFEEGRGPVLPEPLIDEGRIEALRPVEPAEALGYVGEALRLTRAGLPDGVALLGFCGAPFTLACYAIEGGHSRSHARVRRMMYREPALFGRLMDRLAEVVDRHLAFQLASGADAVVLFDTWAGTLGRDDYERFARPWSERALASALDRAPTLAFVLGGGHLMDRIVALGTSGVVVDWRQSIGAAFERWGDRVALQGNLDPAVLLATPEDVSRRTRAVLDEVGGRPGHVLALGHGVMKETDPECVAAFVEVARAAVAEGSAP